MNYIFTESVLGLIVLIWHVWMVLVVVGIALLTLLDELKSHYEKN